MFDQNQIARATTLANCKGLHVPVSIEADAVDVDNLGVDGFVAKCLNGDESPSYAGAWREYAELLVGAVS